MVEINFEEDSEQIHIRDDVRIHNVSLNILFNLLIVFIVLQILYFVAVFITNYFGYRGAMLKKVDTRRNKKMI